MIMAYHAILNSKEINFMYVTYDQIYEEAKKASNFEGLRNKLIKLYGNKEKIHVDERKIGQPYITAAAQLAFEKEYEKVEWLEQLGAYQGYIARAYAYSRNHKMVKKYGREAQHIVIGYAMAGADKLVCEYVRNDPDLIQMAAIGYAMAGRCIEDILKTLNISDKSMHAAMAYGYAINGDHQNIDALFYSDASNERKIFLNAGLGYAESLNDKKVRDYLKNGWLTYGEINSSAYRDILNASSLNRSMARRYDIKYLLKEYSEKRSNIRDSNGDTKEYFYSKFFADFQKSFTQKRDAVDALSSALDGRNVDLMKHKSTLRNGQLGEKLRAFVKSGCANELIDGKEVNTISNFLIALQDKISKNTQNHPS
jgi:hypothetical protein